MIELHDSASLTVRCDLCLVAEIAVIVPHLAHEPLPEVDLAIVAAHRLRALGWRRVWTEAETATGRPLHFCPSCHELAVADVAAARCSSNADAFGEFESERPSF